MDSEVFLEQQIDPAVRQVAEQMNIEASAKLASGDVLTAKHEFGLFSWRCNGEVITIDEAQEMMKTDTADEWTFEGLGDQKLTMRRPTHAEALEAAKRREIAARNAAVDVKKKAKKKAKKKSNKKSNKKAMNENWNKPWARRLRELLGREENYKKEDLMLSIEMTFNENLEFKFSIFKSEPIYTGSRAMIRS